ncbi:MAG: lytic transglycosylase [Podoviridae sp. cty5g4]|nr:MAG: lytic transglycosylase [Podoviridae sp. cty5g4]
MQVEATAYCSCYKCCGKHLGDAGYGITRSGTQVRPGVVAVDPRVIPLGSRVRIQGKIFWAEDTGGAIKGRRIDIYCTTHKAALEWGRREIEIEILGKGKGK